MKQERRRYKRIKKNFILTYFDKKNPEQRFELTQLKNIGRGGMCFITSRKFEPSTVIGVELKTPYLSEITHLEGVILGSEEKVTGVIFETRLEFKALTSQAEIMLDQLIDFFISGEKKYNE